VVVSEAADQIRGEEGTDVTLKIQREGEAETFDVTITRARIQINPVSWAMMPDDVLWVHISQFSSGTTDQLKAALAAGKELGARGVILDLRSNPGGLVEEAKGVGSQFLPEGSVLYQELDADGNMTEVSLSGNEGEWQEGPLVVLIDSYSASASEITSSSIAENGRGTLIGETTYGTGTVLLPMELSDESMVLIGTELWLTSSGQDIWHKGVAPEVEVSNDVGVQLSLPYLFSDNTVSESQVAEVDDLQVLAALEEISGQIGGQ
jgi:carboxyl-terminal processing protease